MTRLFDAKPFIIAEVGSNWETFEHCVASIEQAKVAGADAVKFQAFTGEALYGFPSVRLHNGPMIFTPDGIFKIEAHQLPLDWLPRLAEHAKVVGIEFMCTAFSPELVAAVDPYISVHKVASSDLTYPQLLQAVAKTRKPVVLSTGASSRGDIAQALTYLDKAKTVLMYCVSAYPARTTCLNVIRHLEDGFDHDDMVGFSDHSTDILGLPVEACHLYQARVLEKHLTAFPDLDTPDRPHSLTVDEFKLMVDHIRGTREPAIGPSYEEKAMMLRHNRRLVASRDVAAGETLAFGVTYGAFRTLEDDDHGLSPFLWDHAQWGPEGKAAKRDIKRGKGVGPGDF